MKHVQGNIPVSIGRFSQVHLIWENCPKIVKQSEYFWNQCMDLNVCLPWSKWILNYKTTGYWLDSFFSQFINTSFKLFYREDFWPWISLDFIHIMYEYLLHSSILGFVWAFCCWERSDFIFMWHRKNILHYVLKGIRQEHHFPFNLSFLILNNSMQNKTVLEITYTSDSKEYS